MRVLASTFALISVACVCKSRRVQKTDQPNQDLTSLARLLQTPRPAAAFKPTATGLRLGKCASGLKPQRFKCMAKANAGRITSLKMCDMLWTEEDQENYWRDVEAIEQDEMRGDNYNEVDWGVDGQYQETVSGDLMEPAEERGIQFVMPPDAEYTGTLKWKCAGPYLDQDKKVELIIPPDTEYPEDCYFGFTADSDPAYSTDPYRAKLEKIGGMAFALDVYFCPDEVPGFNDQTDYPSGGYEGTMCMIYPDEPSVNKYYRCVTSMQNEPGQSDTSDSKLGGKREIKELTIDDLREDEKKVWGLDDIMSDENPEEVEKAIKKQKEKEFWGMDQFAEAPPDEELPEYDPNDLGNAFRDEGSVYFDPDELQIPGQGYYQHDEEDLR